MIKPIPYGRQHITKADIQAVVDVLKSDYLTQGPKVREFEEAFSTYIGAKYAVAVSNGTAALHLSAMVLGVKPGDKVITTPITFAATANSVRYCGGEVVFADIEPETYLLDINEVRKLLETSPRGTYKGIITVDFAGRAIDMEKFRELADEYDLWIIEDACHAPGGYFSDSKANKQFCGNSNFAELAIFSFHPVKHIASGEGGMITTNDENLYKKLLMLRTHGITKDPELLKENHGAWYYEMQELGFNYRLTDLQSALALSQLKRADEGLIKRRKIAETYHNAFKDKAYIKGQSGLNDGHAYHLYIIEVEDRKKLYEYLHKNNILVQVHYIPVNMLPYYKKSGKKDKVDNSKKFYDHCISLPMYPTLNDDQQDYVIQKILSFFN